MDIVHKEVERDTHYFFNKSLPFFAKSIKKKRVCLMCGKIFNSAGAYNRRCSKCERLLKIRKSDKNNETPVYKVLQESNASNFNWDFSFGNER